VFVSRVRNGERTTASILHADLDSFYASVEQRDDAGLRGRPVAVGGGVVLAASYEARRFGVRTPMPEREARRCCPGLVVVRPRFEAYTEASRGVFAVFDDTSPLVEGISIDEAFLDVGGLRRVSGAPVEIARRLRREVRERVGLPITVGVARTKFLAKVASAVGKPDGLLVVEPDGELDFLHPLPVGRLWGVGPITAAKLAERGVRTVGDVAALPEPVVVGLVGSAVGHRLYALSHNRDARPVEVGRRRGSIGSQQALGRRPRGRAEIEVVLHRLVDRITRRMRGAERRGRTVTLRLRFGDHRRATRSSSLRHATASTAIVLAVARGLLDDAWPMVEERGLTLLGVSVGNLDDSGRVQLVLPFERGSADELDAAVDAVRDRYGWSALTRAGRIGTDDPMTVPLLPD
jgi:DNA polymerase-4